MTPQLQFRIDELFGGAARCEHLAPAEMMDLAEGRLGAGRLEALEQHARSCAACTALLDDVETFRRLTVSGVTVPAERKAFEHSEARIRRRVGFARLLSRFRGFLMWSVPAFAAMLLLVLWLAPRPEPLVAEIERMPLVPPPTVRGSAAAGPWREIVLAWSSDDMPRVRALLESAASGSADASLWFYLGHARLLAGDARGAVEALRRADALESGAPSEHTRWMLAAALERTGRRDEACAALRSVAEIGGVRQAAARERVERGCAPHDQSAP